MTDPLCRGALPKIIIGILLRQVWLESRVILPIKSVCKGGCSCTADASTSHGLKLWTLPTRCGIISRLISKCTELRIRGLEPISLARFIHTYILCTCEMHAVHNLPLLRLLALFKLLPEPQIDCSWQFKCIRGVQFVVLEERFEVCQNVGGERR